MGISSSQYNFTPDERQQIDQEIDNVLQSLFIEIRQNFNFYKLKKILHLASGRMNLDHGSIELGYKGCAGWMHKEGGKIKTWKYRFMRLNKNGTLKYYKKLEDEGEDQQKGSLSVIGYKIQKDPNQMREVMIKQLSHIFNIDPTTIQIPICAPEVFELYDETKRIWRMQPDSLDEKERWIKGIQNVQLYDRIFLTEDWTITNCFINTLNKTLYWKSREIPHYASIFSRNIQELVFRVIVPRIEYIIFAQKYKSLQGNWESRNDDFTSIRGAYFKYVSNRLQLKFNDFINNELMKAEKEAEVYLGSSDEGSNNHLLFDGDRIILNVAEQQEDQEEDEFSLLSFHQQGLSEILKTYMQLREMLGAPPTYHPLFQNISNMNQSVDKKSHHKDKEKENSTPSSLSKDFLTSHPLHSSASLFQIQSKMVQYWNILQNLADNVIQPQIEIIKQELLEPLNNIIQNISKRVNNICNSITTRSAEMDIQKEQNDTVIANEKKEQKLKSIFEQEKKDITAVLYQFHHLQQFLRESIKHETTIETTQDLISLCSNLNNKVQDLIKQGQLGRNIEDVTKEMEQKKEKKKQNEEKTQNSDDHETKKKNPTVSFLLYDRNELESKLQIHTITILCRSLQSLEVSIQHQKQKVEQMLQDEKDEEERIKKEKEKEKEKESKLENVITRQIELNRKEQKDQNEDDEDEDVKQDERTVENSADYEIKKIKPLSYFVSESVSDLQNRYQYDCTALHRKILLSIIHAIVDPIFFTAAQTLPETQNAGQTISMNVSAAFAIVLRPTMMLDDIMADAIDFAAIRMLGKDFPQGNMKLPTIQFPSKSDLVNSSDDQEFLHTFF